MREKGILRRRDTNITVHYTVYCLAMLLSSYSYFSRENPLSLPLRRECKKTISPVSDRPSSWLLPRLPVQWWSVGFRPTIIWVTLRNTSPVVRWFPTDYHLGYSQEYQSSGGPLVSDRPSSWLLLGIPFP